MGKSVYCWQMWMNISIYGDMVERSLKFQEKRVYCWQVWMDTSTYGDVVGRSLELTERNVYAAGIREDATPKVFPSSLSFLFNFIEADRLEIYVQRSPGMVQKG